MFDNDLANAVLVVMAIWLFAKWLTAEKPLKWIPRIIRGGKR